jgi:long-chain fatty acid transport protein
MRLGTAALLGGTAFLCVVTASPDGRAEGFSVARFGGEHGHPTTTNATAIYYNPAGIGMSEGFHIFGDVNLAWRQVTYEHQLQPGDNDTLPGANTGQNKLFNILASPMLGVTGKFGDFALGAGFYVPFGGRGNWKKNDAFKDHPNYAGPYDGVQRWYAIDGEITSTFITLAAAYHIKPARLSIGVSGNLILSKTFTVRAKTAAGDNDVRAEGRSLLDVSGTDWSMGFGLLYEAMKDQLWLGASYQSQPNFSGMKPQKGKFSFEPAGNETVNDAELETDLPDIIRVGTRYRPVQDIELRLFGDYQRWSVMKRQCVYKAGTSCNVGNDGVSPNGDALFNQPRDWKDAFGVRAGVSKWVSKPVEVFGGLGYSSSAVPDNTLEPALPDWDAMSATIGGRFEVVKQVFASGSYTQFYYFPRDSSGKFDVDNRFQGATHNPDAGGSYKQLVGVLNLNLDIGF